MSEQQLEELLRFSPIREAVCANLSFEEADQLRAAFNLEELDCSIVMNDHIDGVLGIFSRVNSKTKIAYEEIKKYGIYHSLKQAIKKKDKELIRILLRFRGKNTSYFYDPPLMVARRRHDLEIMQFLLDLGADIEESNDDGTTPLLSAVWNMDKSSIKFLLGHGANPSNSNKHGSTPLMSATIRGSNSMVQMLLKAGADVNAMNQIGETALMKAARNNSIDVVQTLLKNGADPHPANGRGQTALDIARESNHFDIVKLLQL